MADLQKFGTALDQMVQLMMEMKKALNEEDTPQTTQAPQVQTQAVQNNLTLESYQSLVQALQSSVWPEAVNPNLICNPQSEADKQDRGRGIVELMIEEDLKDLKFLDYGCGEGHAAGLAVEYAPQLSVGFDVTPHAAWSNFNPNERLRFTTNFEEVAQLGPYNVVLLFDVIDHIKGEDAASLLRKAKSVLAPNGKIYLRCHPFTSRHATHLYHTLNKAYLHLIFTDAELTTLVPQPLYKEESTRVIYPIKTYGDFIEQAGLKVISRRDVTERVEPFFKTPYIADRIIKNTKMGQFPEFQMGLQFVDYVLGNP